MWRSSRPFTYASVLAALGLIAWEIGPPLLQLPGYLVPQFSTVVASALNSRSLIAEHASWTALEAVAGFVIGAFVGVGTGVGMALSPRVRFALLPYVVASNAVPVIAVAPLVVLWIGHGFASKSALAAFLCFFPVAINTYRALIVRDTTLEDVILAFGGSSSDVFMRLRIPSSLPFVIAGLKLSATYSVIGAIVAEFVGSNRGLGYAMVQSAYSLNTARLFAYLIVACALGIAMYGLVAVAERRLLRRYLMVTA